MPKLDRLQTLVEEYNGEAGELISEIESTAVNTAFAEPVRAIGERIDEFEFDGALVLLTELRETIGAQTSDSRNLGS